MAAQPLSKVLPRAAPVFGNHAVAARADLAELGALAFAAINAYSDADNAVGEIFTTLLHADYHVGLRIYQSFKSGAQQLNALNIAAQEALSQTDQDLLSAALIPFKSARKRRNEIAHHVWGCDPNLPDAILSVDPKDKQANWVELRDYTEKYTSSASKTTNFPRSFTEAPEISHDKIRVWRKNDFEDLIGSSNLASELMIHFHLLLLMPNNLREKVRDKLRSYPQVQKGIQDQQAHQTGATPL